jgi:serine/threonine-protein kinase
MPATETSPIAADRQRLPSVSFGPFAFDTHTRLLRRGAQEVALPPRVLGVLELLLQRAGDVVSRQELIDAVWKDAFVTDTSLAEAVSVLRQALADDPQAPTYIQTLHRRGYRFVAPVSTPSPAGRTAAVRVDAPGPAIDVSVVSPSIGGQLVPWSAAIICALIAVAAVWQLTRTGQGASTPAARFAVTPAAGTAFDASAPALAFSPDGTQLAWSGCDAGGCRLYVRPLDRLEPVVMPGTEDGHAPFFSPDGRWIAFFADGRLKKVALAGGAPVTLADAPSVLGGTWVDGEIVFAGSPSGGLARVSANGGDPRALTTPREGDGEVRHAWPSRVPGSRVVLFTIDTMAIDGAPGMMAALSFDAAASSDASRWRTLVAGVDIARAAAPDTIVFGRGSELEALAFDPIRLAVAGSPRAVLAPIATVHGRAHYALSQSGSVAWAMTPSSPSREVGLTWWSPSGFQAATDEVRPLRDAALSPDGSRLAGVNLEGARADIWVTDVRRGTATRLTHSGINASPIWSADGRTVYFASRTGGVFEIWGRVADGSQVATRVPSGAAEGRHSLPVAVSPDGAMIAFMRTAPSTRADLLVAPLGGGPGRPLVNGPFDDIAAAFSPDSRLAAFQSAETGTWEIYLQRLRDGRRLVVSTDGGERPVWARDGLYFQSRGHLVRAAIADAETFRVEGVTRLGDLQGATLRGVSADGRILVERDTNLSHGTAIVSLEWLREVRALLGPPATALPR